MSSIHHLEVAVPLLRLLADGRVKTMRALLEGLSVRHRHKTKKGRRRNPSSSVLNRLAEARARLESASLLKRISRRRCRITPHGWKALQCQVQSRKLREGGLCTLPLPRGERGIKSDRAGESHPQKSSFPRRRESHPRSVNWVDTEECSVNVGTVNDIGVSRTTRCKGGSCSLPLQDPDCGDPQGKTPHRERGLPISSGEANPEEALEHLYQALRENLISEILDKLKKVSPVFFERLVLDVLLRMGYGSSRHDAAATTKPSGDGGVDGYIKEDTLGLDVIYVQAKRWENPVGRPDVQAFVGSLEGLRSRKGVFMTTSRFTREARDYADKIAARIVLIDGQQLAQFMMETRVGITEYKHYSLKKLDSGYFLDEQAIR